MFDALKIRNLNQTEILGSLASLYALRMQELAGSINDTIVRELIVRDFDKALTNYTTLRYFEASDIVCDMSNNTPEWIQGNNPCKVEIYIRWSKASQEEWHLKFPLDFGPNEC